MTLGEGLNGRDNALNVLRLGFALLVILAHSYAFTGHPMGATNLGSWAVAGFFAISGHLIPQARFRSSLGDFLLRRARRIYPAFWTCLLFTAFVFSPVAARLAGSQYEPDLALRYVIVNLTTQMNQYLIGPETVGTRAAWHEWNGSAWTLVFEITCYLVVGALFVFPWLRRRQSATAATWLVLATGLAVATSSAPSLLWFMTFFAAGWLISTRRADIRPTWIGVGLAAVLGIGLGVLVSPTLAALPLAYGVLSAGMLLPGHRMNDIDISYGTYLYGWPMQQLLLVSGADRLGAPTFGAMAVACALVSGALSWFLVERHFLPSRVKPPGKAKSSAFHPTGARSAAR